VIPDPERRGRALAAFFLEIEPRLFADLEESGVLDSAAAEGTRALRRREWECFALYACVRGLVAAGGFNRETARAIDALHEDVLSRWQSQAAEIESFEARRARVSERYAEYGAIGQDGGASGAATVSTRLGEAAARHLAGPNPPEELAALVGGAHEALAEGSAEAVRRAE
jgi:inactivated superfamily I helicase